MKSRHVAILFVAFVANVLASPCEAAFSYMWLVNYSCHAPGLSNHRVWRVYCQFNNPGDRLVGVFGIPASPCTISGSFYNNAFTGQTAPAAEVIAKHPEAQWDTFCTIGIAINNGADQTITSPGFPQLPVTNNTNMSWSIPIVAADQGTPDADGMVLVAQLTIPGGGTPGNFQAGIAYVPAGAQNFVTVYNVSYVLLPLTAGDVNHDLTVGINDLVAVITHWNQTGPGIPDATDDGVVDINDLVVVLTNWGHFTGSCP